MLYLLIDAHTVEEGFPMHRHVYLQELLDALAALRGMEHMLHDGDGYNIFRARQPVLAS